MTETTRPNIKSGDVAGSRVWYRDSDDERELPLERVRKVTVRFGDDSRVQGPFRLSATRMRVEQIHDNQDQTLQTFEQVNRPGVLLNVDGQISDAIHGVEIAEAQIDKSSEKVISKTTVMREIVALGVWSRAVGRKASTEVYTNITVADAIKRTLEAIGLPYGRIDPTPNAMLNYFWISDRDDATSVLAGLVDAAGPHARLDDYTGQITFSAEPAGVDRLTIYGGSGIGDFGSRPEGVRSRSAEGTGVYSGGSGVLPPGTLYGSFLPFQASLSHRYDFVNEQSSWFVQPFSEFTYDGTSYLVERVRSGFDSIKQRYYIEASLIAQGANALFGPGTFNQAGIDPLYLNFNIGGTHYLQKRLSHTSATWGELSVRASALDSVPAAEAGAWLFESNTLQEGVQVRGRFRFEVTAEIAQAVGEFTFALVSDAQASLSVISAPSESQRLVFSDWRRSNDDSRYFNKVEVTSVTRVLDTDESAIWESGDAIPVPANGSTTIRVRSSDGTPFRLSASPFRYTANSDLSSITASRDSGSEIDVTITAGVNSLLLEGLSVRGRFYSVALERVRERLDAGAIRVDDEIPWESAGKFPVDLDFNYLESWLEGRLEVGLERRYTVTLEAYGWDPYEDGVARNQHQTLMRLRPGRLVRVQHGRGTWLGTTREIERISGTMVDEVDRYKITCELAGVEQLDETIIRVGLDAYGSRKVLG